MGARGGTTRRTGVFASAAWRYWREIFPLVRRELTYWRRRAAAIPDPVLRRDALFTHHTKSRNSEGAAAYGILVPRVHLRSAVRGIVAFELMLDYLDTISEQPVVDPLANGLQLHRAFDNAVAVDAALDDYYAFHPQRDDGGYLKAQVVACQEALTQLPSYAAVADALRRSAALSGQAQSFSHAVDLGLDKSEIEAWARDGITEAQFGSDLRWWEIAAAGSSSLPVVVLIASAANPMLSEDDLARIEGAYSPWIAALSSLLDCLVDLADDDEAGQPNHLRRYSSEEEVAERLGWIASESLRLTSDLPQNDLHELVLAGIGGYYLASRGTWEPERERISLQVLEGLGRFASPALAVHCIRQGRPRAALRVAHGGTAA